jgi:hypothetical protein
MPPCQDCTTEAWYNVQVAEPELRRVYDPERINRALALAIAEPDDDADPEP